jgi:hypothetical protein
MKEEIICKISSINNEALLIKILTFINAWLEK